MVLALPCADLPWAVAAATPPPDAVLVPVVAVPGPALLLGVDEAGRLVAEAFTSPARLVARWGPRQPWVAWSRQDLAVVLLALDVDVVVFDAGSGHERTVHASRDREPDA